MEDLEESIIRLSRNKLICNIDIDLYHISLFLYLLYFLQIKILKYNNNNKCLHKNSHFDTSQNFLITLVIAVYFYNPQKITIQRPLKT